MMKAGSISMPLVLSAVLMTGGCSSTSSDTDTTSDGPSIPRPVPITAIEADSAAHLAQSTMSMIIKLVALSDITTTVIQDGAGLLSGQPLDTAEITACTGSPVLSGPSTNDISYLNVSGGFDLPPGDALIASFVECPFKGIHIEQGVVNIAGINLNGDPTTNNWSAQAIVAIGPPIDILNGNDTRTSITDEWNYSAIMTNGSLTTTFEVAADPGEGISGGLNTQTYYLGGAGINPVLANHQFRPFRIRTVDNAGSGDYTIGVEAHSTDGDSLLERYTNRPDSEIQVEFASVQLSPFRWPSGQPDRYTDSPADGEIEFSELGCANCGSITAVVDQGDVDLSVFDGAAMITQSITWQNLVSSPDP